MWEIAHRTIELVKRRFPKARCIWGFSNTTFFHTPIEQLPLFTDGQSYHPALGKQTIIYEVAGKTLWHRDVFAFLP
jgi:hypothetical protein